MASVPVLRISDVPIGDRRRVEVTWQDGQARQAAVSTFSYQVGETDAEKVRWYLEDYAEFPADPAPRLAADAEAILAREGTALFGHVFTGLDAAGIWAQVRAQLPHVRVEVDTDPGEAPGLPWELLRDPGTDTALALGAGEFVRTHLQTAGRAALPQAAGDRLRVLLVICRPGGRDDVPFRSVASRLVRGGAGEMDGLDLDVLRPPTYPRLAEVLHEAAGAGRPYHVVHFDGHGTYLDLAQLDDHEAGEEEAADGASSANGANGGSSGGVGVSPLRFGPAVAGPVRSGPHGYLLFENPGHASNQQLVDGPSLGRLLTATGVPILVLNACRSAWTEAPNAPGPPAEVEGDAEAGHADDVHSRIRAYGSLAAEVADAGTPGVVAMRYNVYVVTAAQYMADLYAHLLAGKSLGQAATAARRALADDPARQITSRPVELQDWAVPVVYEAAPLSLLGSARAAPLIKLELTGAENVAGTAAGSLPRPPDAGFYGRDETLLALDRAFDTQHAVLLHAFAGAGKSSTAAEFARWYQLTGGLDLPGHPELSPGPVIWSSFEHHLRLDRLVGTAGDHFTGLFESSGIQWQAVTKADERRSLLFQVLAQLPVLWVWDNVEPVTGFPQGTDSAWTQAEQDDLRDFLRDLAQRTRCKVLLTSRRDERPWLASLPARLPLPVMPMRERLQLAAALIDRHGEARAGQDWRPLLRYTGGNPLAITVLVGQALRENLITSAQIETFVGRLRAGEAELEPGEDAALGRTRSLAASLSYGFAHAFTENERAQLAVLHIFRDTVDADAIRMMGDPLMAQDDAVPELSGLSREATAGLLDRAAEVGLLTYLGAGYYSIHPALPWYFTALFTRSYGPHTGASARRVSRAYAHVLSVLSRYYARQEDGRANNSIPALRAEEANFRHALDLALQAGLWADAVGCLHSLMELYQRTGRESEWARLVAQISPHFVDSGTGSPIPGRESEWAFVAQSRVRLARDARDWPLATRLQKDLIDWSRRQAAPVLATGSADEMTAVQRNHIRTMAVSLAQFADILRLQEDPGCLGSYEEALGLYQRIGARYDESMLALSLGNTYETVPGLRNLEQAERWFQHCLDLRDERDRLGRARPMWGLGNVAAARFRAAVETGEPDSVLLEHVNTALQRYLGALQLIPADDIKDLAGVHNQIGIVYDQAGESRQAIYHYQQSLKYKEIGEDTYSAGLTRFNIASLYASDRRLNDALLYARAALSDFERVGQGARQDALDAEALIAQIEHGSR